MSIVIEPAPEQRTPEWYALRRGRITASAVGAILNVAPYMTRDAVMRRMVREFHGLDDEFKGNIATDYGVTNEPNALFAFQLETYNKVEPAPFFCREEWAGASPDGLIGEDDLIEIKCPFKFRATPAPVPFDSILDEKLLHYYHQVMFQLWATGRKGTYFYQWSPVDSKTEYVAYCKEWEAEFIPQLRAFYDEYLIERESNYQHHLEEKRPEIDTLAVRNALNEYDELALAVELAKDRMSEIIDELALASGNRSATLCGRPFTLVQRDGAVSYAKLVKDKLPDLKPEELEKYRGKSSEYWKLT